MQYTGYVGQANGYTPDYHDRMTLSQGVKNIQLDWIATRLSVTNLTPSTLYVRVGGNDTPTYANFDYAVAAGGSLNGLPVHSNVFSFAFGEASLAQNASINIQQGLTSAATITLSPAGRSTPSSYGAFNPLTLSSLVGPTSIGSNGQIVGPFDISSWGGVLLWYQTGVSQGLDQWSLDVQHSPDGSTWYFGESLPVWSNTTIQAQIPRVQRYIRFVLTRQNGSGIVNCLMLVRAALAEILDLRMIQANVATGQGLTVAAGGGLNLDIYVGSASGLAFSMFVPTSTSRNWQVVVTALDQPSSPSIFETLDRYSFSGVGSTDNAYAPVFVSTLPWIRIGISNNDAVSLTAAVQWRLPMHQVNYQRRTIATRPGLTANNILLAFGGANVLTDTGLALPLGQRMVLAEWGQAVAAFTQFALGTVAAASNVLGYGSGNTGRCGTGTLDLAYDYNYLQTREVWMSSSVGGGTGRVTVWTG